jgi:hypothetical protein
MAQHGKEAPLQSLSTRMEPGGGGRGAGDSVLRQLQSVGRLAVYLHEDSSSPWGHRYMGMGGATWDRGGGAADWDGRMAP